ncbi:single-stranded DNA-binding protein [Psittacicella gerlachiana]|uniref:Single-stranded DNA-binding protein n=1 Tax=Psittacicella gerlachiana TaxID=2028574 RepID=A0A3A1YD45_9GAMM|nr:single-stranded DNA-binding protein [Psittacicella gerlachiana]RIY36173.1 hypothetical protein CKF59_02955 [Psittacicella gerlachiana]
MALYLNRVTLIGNLGQDPQIINGQGYTLYSFSVATSRGYKDNNTGEWVNITDWHRCSLFVTNNTPANLVQAVQNLRKGAYVYVEGSLRNRKYTDQATNTERTAIDISVESLNILERQSTSGNFGNNQNFGNQGFGNNNQGFGNNNQGFANNQNFQNGYGNNANAGNNFANNQNSFNHSGFNNKPTGSFGNNGQSNFANANANAQNTFANNNQASSVTWGNNQASSFNNNSSNNDSPYDHFANTNTSFKKDVSEGEANKKEDKAPVDNVSNEDIPF